MNRTRGFVLRVGRKIADGGNGATLIDGLFNFLGQADVLHLHFTQLEPHRLEIRSDAIFQHLPHQRYLGFEVDDRKAELRQHFFDA